MSLMDKIKGFFSGSSSDTEHDHSGHDHSGHDHSHEPEAAAPMAPAEPMGMPEPSPTPGEPERRDDV